jgi:hypothetical protein
MAATMAAQAARMVPRTAPLMPARRFASVERKLARDPEVTASLSKNSISSAVSALHRELGADGDTYLTQYGAKSSLSGSCNKLALRLSASFMICVYKGDAHAEALAKVIPCK